MASTHKVIEYTYNRNLLLGFSFDIDRYNDSYIEKRIKNHKDNDKIVEIGSDAEIEGFSKELYAYIDGQVIDEIVRPLNTKDKETASDKENRKAIVKALKKYVKEELLPKEKLKALLKVKRDLAWYSFPETEKKNISLGIVNTQARRMFDMITMTIEKQPGCSYKNPTEKNLDVKIFKWLAFVLIMVFIIFIVYKILTYPEYGRFP